MSHLAPVLMVQGTASSAGKSTLVAGLCRLLSRRGVHVAPFKAQNMSNNAAVCRDGGEIGRAQFAQAQAAMVEPSIDMNPILLKPQAGSCQVIIRGRVQGIQTAADYFGPRRGDLWPVVVEALDSLRSRFDLVIAEGAGSPAEINLRDRDIVNMRVALHTRADVLIVADIDRGGAFAALLGTWQWLAPEERALVRGFILNRFRGDAAMLAPGPDLLEARTGVRLVGVVPYLSDLALPDEDTASLAERPAPAAAVELAVVQLPHLANFDEFSAFAVDPGVGLRYVSRPEELRAPDLVILPGSKATIPDLLWLHDRGLAGRVRWLAEHGTPVLGICGGYQMLGEFVTDPRRVESEHSLAVGLSLLPIRTELGSAKHLTRTHGRARAGLAGIWAALSGLAVEGYEMHMGCTTGSVHAALLDLDGGPEGAVSASGVVAGTYLHGIFERPEPRHALLGALASTRGFRWNPGPERKVDAYDALADVLAVAIDLPTL
jgi:adenosylcobyric acid synthase